MQTSGLHILKTLCIFGLLAGIGIMEADSAVASTSVEQEAGNSGSATSAVGQGLSWYPVDTSNATPAEYRVAALVLVFHATTMESWRS